MDDQGVLVGTPGAVSFLNESFHVDFEFLLFAGAWLDHNLVGYQHLKQRLLTPMFGILAGGLRPISGHSKGNLKPFIGYVHQQRVLASKHQHFLRHFMVAH